MNSSIGSWAICAAFASTALLVSFHSAIAVPKNAGAQPPIKLNRGAEANATSDIQQNPSLPPGLRDAPERLIDGELVLGLKAYIWRDFMPFSTSQDAAGLAAQEKHTSMVAIVTLTDDHGMPVPPTLHAEKIWILQGEFVWETSTIEERRNDSRCDFVVRNGPKWQPRSAVDVIVRLEDENGRSFLLAIRHQAIGAVS